MSKKAWFVLVLLTMGGCRIVSQQELADLKSPSNPHMTNIDQTWQNKIVPQIVGQTCPVVDLLMTLHAEKDSDSACKNLGYRSQEENPRIFYVQVGGKVSNLDTASRSGKMTIADKNGNSIIVQIGPMLHGTQPRGAFKGTNYSGFDDRVLFGKYGRGANKQTIKMIQSAQLKTGESVHVYGILSE